MSQHSHDAHHQHDAHERRQGLPYNDDDSRADMLAALSLVLIAVLTALYFVSGL